MAYSEMLRRKDCAWHANDDFKSLNTSNRENMRSVGMSAAPMLFTYEFQSVINPLFGLPGDSGAPFVYANNWGHIRLVLSIKPVQQRPVMAEAV